MKIMFFSQNFEPEIGAGPQRIYAHTRRWVAAGHKVVVITCFPTLPYGKVYEGYKNRLLHKEVIEGIQVYRFFTIPAGKKDSLWVRGIGALFYAFFCLMIMPLRFKPDIVCGSVPYFASLPAFFASKLFRVPFVYEMRDPWLQVLHKTGKMGILSRIIYRSLFALEYILLRFSDKVVVISEEMARMIQDTYRLKEKPTVIFNAADTDVISQSLDGEDGDADFDFAGCFVVGFIGNFGSQYDFDSLLKAAELLKDEPCVFAFVGEGSMKQKVMDKAAENELPNVRFFDAVPYRIALKRIRKCDVTVIPLRSDDIYKVYLSLRAIESLAIACPVIVSCGGDLAGLIEKSGGGAVFESCNHEQLASIIAKYMKNKGLLEEKGKAGAQYVRDNLTRDKMANKCLDLFSTLITN